MPQCLKNCREHLSTWQFSPTPSDNDYQFRFLFESSCSCSPSLLCGHRQRPAGASVLRGENTVFDTVNWTLRICHLPGSSSSLAPLPHSTLSITFSGEVETVRTTKRTLTLPRLLQMPLHLITRSDICPLSTSAEFNSLLDANYLCVVANDGTLA